MKTPKNSPTPSPPAPTARSTVTNFSASLASGPAAGKPCSSSISRMTGPASRSGVPYLKAATPTVPGVSRPRATRSHATLIAWSTSGPKPGSTNLAASRASPAREESTESSLTLHRLLPGSSGMHATVTGSPRPVDATPGLTEVNVVRPRAARCGRSTLTPPRPQALTGTCPGSQALPRHAHPDPRNRQASPEANPVNHQVALGNELRHEL